MDQYQDLLDGLVDIVESQGPFDGLMGFSEGGIVAAMLLVEDSRRPFAGFKCGIFFSAAPPLDPDDIRNGTARCLNPATDGVAVKIPTAHIWSSKTAEAGFGQLPSPLAHLWSGAGWENPERVHEALARLCNERLCEVFMHDLGHGVPGSTSDQGLRGTLRAIEHTIENARA